MLFMTIYCGRWLKTVPIPLVLILRPTPLMSTPTRVVNAVRVSKMEWDNNWELLHVNGTYLVKSGRHTKYVKTLMGLWKPPLCSQEYALAVPRIACCWRNTCHPEIHKLTRNPWSAWFPGTEESRYRCSNESSWKLLCWNIEEHANENYKRQKSCR